MALWNEKGFAATRLDDVAAAANISKGTIYLYFESKEALFEEAVKARLVATMNGVADMGRAFEGSTEDVLRLAFQMIFAQLFDQGGIVFLKVLISEGHRFPKLARRYEEVALARGMEVIRGILARGVERGELTERALRIDPRLVVGPVILVSLLDSVFGGGEPANREQLADQFIKVLLEGLTA